MRQSNNYWTLERCQAEALKYKNKAEWEKFSRTSYNKAIKMKWMNLCSSHFITLWSKKWTFEQCQTEALKYKTKSEWQKNSNGSYQKAVKMKWINLCSSHFTILWSKKWTKENCIADAKKYNSIIEWSKNSGSAYNKARERKWIKECTKHMKILGNRMKRMIYAFEFPDHSVYIGLTYNSTVRKTEHLDSKKGKKSSVYRYIEKTGFTPIYKELTNYLNVKTAIRKEEKFVEKYNLNGWTILNKVATGGLGGNIKKWTREKCHVDALKFKTINEWRKKSGGAYNQARKNNWLECFKHMNRAAKPIGFWTFETCLQDALNYDSIKKWRTTPKSGYSIASKRNWLKIIKITLF
jgi:hypothetical protein